MPTLTAVPPLIPQQKSVPFESRGCTVGEIFPEVAPPTFANTNSFSLEEMVGLFRATTLSVLGAMLERVEIEYCALDHEAKGLSHEVCTHFATNAGCGHLLATRVRYSDKPDLVSAGSVIAMALYVLERFDRLPNARGVVGKLEAIGEVLDRIDGEVNATYLYKAGRVDLESRIPSEVRRPDWELLDTVSLSRVIIKTVRECVRDLPSILMLAKGGFKQLLGENVDRRIALPCVPS